jgi:hypothetical protein
MARDAVGDEVIVGFIERDDAELALDAAELVGKVG